MLVCAPDMDAEIAERHGVVPCLLATMGARVRYIRGGAILVDIGLRRALNGVDAHEYYMYVRRAVSPYPQPARFAVVPDVFGDFDATLRAYLQYAPAFGKHARPLLVAQDFGRRLDDVVREAAARGLAYLALPMRRHPDAACARRPDLCAERAEKALRRLCGWAAHIHLLGPALRSLRALLPALRDCERLGTRISFDTTAHHMAPNRTVKAALGGTWQAPNGEWARRMLDAWLAQAGL